MRFLSLCFAMLFLGAGPALAESQVPTLHGGIFVYTVPEGFHPPGIEYDGILALQALASQSRHPFYVVIFDKIETPEEEQKSGLAQITEATERVWNTWAEKNPMLFNPETSSLFVLSYQPRYIRLMTGSRWQKELSLTQDRMVDFLGSFRSVLTGTPKDPTRAILSVMKDLDKYLFEHTDPETIKAKQSSPDLLFESYPKKDEADPMILIYIMGPVAVLVLFGWLIMMISTMVADKRSRRRQLSELYQMYSTWYLTELPELTTRWEGVQTLVASKGNTYNLFKEASDLLTQLELSISERYQSLSSTLKNNNRHRMGQVWNNLRGEDRGTRAQIQQFLTLVVRLEVAIERKSKPAISYLPPGRYMELEARLDHAQLSHEWISDHFLYPDPVKAMQEKEDVLRLDPVGFADMVHKDREQEEKIRARVFELVAIMAAGARHFAEAQQRMTQFVAPSDLPPEHNPEITWVAVQGHWSVMLTVARTPPLSLQTKSLLAEADNLQASCVKLENQFKQMHDIYQAGGDTQKILEKRLEAAFEQMRATVEILFASKSGQSNTDLENLRPSDGALFLTLAGQKLAQASEFEDQGRKYAAWWQRKLAEAKIVEGENQFLLIKAACQEALQVVRDYVEMHRKMPSLFQKHRNTVKEFLVAKGLAEGFDADRILSDVWRMGPGILQPVGTGPFDYKALMAGLLQQQEYWEAEAKQEIEAHKRGLSNGGYRYKKEVRDSQLAKNPE